MNTTADVVVLEPFDERQDDLRLMDAECGGRLVEEHATCPPNMTARGATAHGFGVARRTGGWRAWRDRGVAGPIDRTCRQPCGASPACP